MAENDLGSCPNGSPAFAAEFGDEVVVNVQPNSDERIGATGQWKTRITRWNTIEMQLRLKLILPLVVSLLIIVVYASVSMSSRANTWAEPVRAKLVQEEATSLDQRVVQRAAAISER